MEPVTGGAGIGGVKSRVLRDTLRAKTAFPARHLTDLHPRGRVGQTSKWKQIHALIQPPWQGQVQSDNWMDGGPDDRVRQG